MFAMTTHQPPHFLMDFGLWQSTCLSIRNGFARIPKLELVSAVSPDYAIA